MCHPLSAYKFTTFVTPPPPSISDGRYLFCWLCEGKLLYRGKLEFITFEAGKLWVCRFILFYVTVVADNLYLNFK